MMRGLRRQVGRLRRALMADRPPQERTVVIIAGLGLMADDKMRARICDVIKKVQRERGDLSEPAPVAPLGMAQEKRPIHQHQANLRGTPDEPVRSSPQGPTDNKRPRIEPPLQIPNLSDPSQSWQLVINRPPPGPRPLPPGPYRDPPPEDPFGLYRDER